MKTTNPLYGALGGDLVGSIYEFCNIKTKKFPLDGDPCDNPMDELEPFAR